MTGAKAYAAPMTYDEMLALIRRLADRPLRTVTGKEFTASVYLDSPVFTPTSSGLGRSDGRKAAERFLARYNETGSLRPVDYGDVSRNASYLIGLILEGRRTGSC
jgi:hypothetical protein